MNTHTLEAFAQKQFSPGRVTVDFLFLDLNTCTRCVGTDTHLETAMKALEQVLTLAGVQLTINKVRIDSEEKAREYQFVTSPTIRVNGRDIALETKERSCDPRSDLCGCEEGTMCRIWVYRGEEYTEAPVAMIIEAILREVFDAQEKTAALPGDYDEVPQDLKRYLSGQETRSVNTSAHCCAPEVLEGCCDPSEKQECCGELPRAGVCGCQ